MGRKKVIKSPEGKKETPTNNKGNNFTLSQGFESLNENTFNFKMRSNIINDNQDRKKNTTEEDKHVVKQKEVIPDFIEDPDIEYDFVLKLIAKGRI